MSSVPIPSEFARRVEEAQPRPLISVVFDESGFTEDDIKLVLSYLSEVYGEAGGAEFVSLLNFLCDASTCM